MRTSNLVEFTELLEHAETLGYDWNDACTFLDDFRPKDEANIFSLKLSQLNKKEGTPEFDNIMDVEYPDKVNQVLTSFFQKHAVVDIDIY